MVNWSGSELSCPCTLGFIIRDVTSQMRTREVQWQAAKLLVASTLWPGVQPSVTNTPGWFQRTASLAENEGSVLCGAKVSALKILRPALTA